MNNLNEINFFNTIKSKRLVELSLQELAYIHLNQGEVSEVKDGYMRSSLPVVLREIRHAKVQRYSGSFLPITAAFTVLDQLGFLYKRNDMPAYSDQQASSIKKALYYFCGFGENCRDTKALYALRNSFLHNASLLSKAERRNQPNHRFRFDPEYPNLISYPNEEWDWEFHSLDGNKNTTIINQNSFIELVEDAVSKAIELLNSGDLEVSLAGGEIEFYYRFLTHESKT